MVESLLSLHEAIFHGFMFYLDFLFGWFFLVYRPFYWKILSFYKPLDYCLRECSWIETGKFGYLNGRLMNPASASYLTMFMAMVTNSLIKFLEHRSGGGLDPCLFLHGVCRLGVMQAKHTLAEACCNGGLHKFTDLTLIPKLGCPGVFHAHGDPR